MHKEKKCGKRDEVERGVIYGLRCVFSPLLTKIRDTTLPGMETEIREHFNPPIGFEIPQKGYNVPYNNEFILNKLGIDSKLETAHRFEQNSDAIIRTFHLIRKQDFSTYVVINYENLKDPVEWKIEGKTIFEDNKNHLFLPNIHITSISPVTIADNGFVFKLERGASQVFLHIETFPLYEEFERTIIIADSSQIEAVAAVLGFFPEHKYVPLIFFDNKENDILKSEGTLLQDQRNEIIKKRKQVLNQIYSLHPKNIILLNSQPELEDIKSISEKLNARLFQLIDLLTGEALPTEELVPTMSLFLDKEIEFLSVENSAYLPVACVLARIKGSISKAVIPILQRRAEHELRIGSGSYGCSEYCGELTEVTRNILERLGNVYEEGVLVEDNGGAQSVMRSIIASNFAYLNYTAPILVNKVHINEEIYAIDSFTKNFNEFLAIIKKFKKEILNDRDLISHLNIKTIDFIKSIEIEVQGISKKDCELEEIHDHFLELIDIIQPYFSENTQTPEDFAKNIISDISEKITGSLDDSIQLLHNFKYITVFTDNTPYNLAKYGAEFWASRFALGHFIEDESHKVAAILLNLLMYSKGREYPIKRILQVAPYAKGHFRMTTRRQGEAYVTALDTGETLRKWTLVLELINDQSDKNTVRDFGTFVKWFNMHFATHGTGSSIMLDEGVELTFDEILRFNLLHTLIDFNACTTFPLVGKVECAPQSRHIVKVCSQRGKPWEKQQEKDIHVNSSSP